ncbi:MAG: flagellin [Lachnospiraceae bacterium]|nr:flagellin [Lachnospiraceae bacterium]
MQIQHNIQAINSSRNLGINNKALAKNLEKLSSGYRINRAGDDAAGLAISEQMRSQINGLNQAATNAQDAIGLIQTAEGALTEVHSMLQRMVTLATQASNATMNTTSWGNIQTEYDALVAEIDRIANYTDFNGTKPLTSTPQRAGEGTGLTFQIGPSGSETITMSAQSMAATTILGTAAATGATAGAIKDRATANASLSGINNAINKVSTYRAKLGAIQNRLEHTVNSLKVTSENIQDAESRIRDTNMPDEITSFTKNNILLQAAQSMLSQANAVPQGVLSLLG